jgi:dTDP-4-amino-4,6-dideoxy-D-galactose acyltransferase
MSDKYKFLEWDSKFFGFGVACINNCIDFQELTDIIEMSKKSGVKLVYYLSSQEQELIRLNKLCRTSRFADTKLLYYKKTYFPKSFDKEKVFEYTGKIPTKDMYVLALESGTYSRFNTDPGIPPGKFNELYCMWIENSVNYKIADKVFCSGNSDKITGLITLAKKENTATIGLLSVNEKFRGQRIGSALISCCENYCVENGLERLFVYTQKENIPACNLYRSNGFTIDNINYVYHLWM